MQSNELCHHGILGMKWGVRRYQNKDGSLTAAGRKRAARLASEYSKVTGENISNHKNSSAGNSSSGNSNSSNSQEKGSGGNRGGGRSGGSTKTSKSIDKMSNEELQSRIDRLRLEQAYASLNPRKVSTGEKIVDSLKSSATSIIKEKGTKLAGDLIDKELRRALGLSEQADAASKTLKVLENEAKSLNYKKQIDQAMDYFNSKSTTTKVNNLIGNIDDLTDRQIQDMITRLDNEEKLRNRLANR